MADPTPFEYDVFISYRHGQPDETWVRHELHPALEQAGLKVCLDENDFVAGSHLILQMDRAERSRHILAVVTPRYFEGSGLAEQEALNAAARDPKGLAAVLIPFVLQSVVLPGWMKNLIRIDWTTEADRANEWKKLLRSVKAPLADTPPPAAPPFNPGTRDYDLLALDGVARVEQVFSSNGSMLSGQVFAVELLKQPIILTKLEDGTIRVVVVRDKVTHGIYTTEGKRKLCEYFLNTPDQLGNAQNLDRVLDRILRGDVAIPTYTQKMTDFQLRWGSGGVLPVVRWRKRLWTPFFFRDIEPVGWNIPLGATKTGDDLNDPWSFLLREFLEELLVLDGSPANAEVHHKAFSFERLVSGNEISEADAFARQHIEQRLEKDGLLIRVDPNRTDKSKSIPVDFGNTRTEIHIVKKGQYDERRNVLICINLLELGIEVVKVVEFKLQEDDYLLDGEILHLPTGPELVRMPIGLISHDYLRRAFSPNRPDLLYVGTRQPSVQAPDIPGSDIHIFPYDAIRRQVIATGAEEGTEWEKQQYRAWLDRFGANFFDDRGNPTNARASNLFTPSAAKLFRYYLSTRH